jgi:DNA-binding transcriptional ArsR family regulator
MTDVFKALAHPVRREVLKRLRDGPLSAGALGEGFDVSAPTMSGHLAVLKETGLVSAERDGTTIRYRLNVSVLEEAMAALMGLMRVSPKEED